MTNPIGISGKLRIILEIVITASILGVTIYFYQIPSFDLQIPMVPIKNWHPTIPEGIYFLMARFANAFKQLVSRLQRLSLFSKPIS